MPIELPPSLQRELHPVEEEVAETRGLSHEERLILLSMACRAAADLARSRPDAERVFAWRDPLPESSRLAFERMGIRWR